MKKFNLGISTLLAVLLVILVAVLVGGGVWWYMNQKQTAATTTTTSATAISQKTTTTTSAGQDETAGWKTYTNTKYNYSLKYPSNLQVSEETPYSTLFYDKQTLASGQEEGVFPSLYVSVMPNGFTNQNSEVYNFISENFISNFFNMKIGEVKQTVTGTSSEFYTYKKLSDTDVAGQKGITMENDNPWQGGNVVKDRRVFVRKNSFTYEIGAYYRTSEELNNFVKFLSNFSFTQ